MGGREREMSNIRLVHDLEDPPISTMVAELRLCCNKYVPFSICRVPPSIRKADPMAYEPQVISIGPYHLQNPNLPNTRDLKRRYMHNLFCRSEGICTDVLLERCIEKVKQSEARARECYQEPLSLSSYDFVMMLLLDGCFILELLHTYNGDEAEDDPIYTIAWMFPSLWEDLLKLENQIPFFILEDLFSIVASKTTYLSVKEPAFYFFREKAPLFVNPIGTEEVFHLLHFFYVLQRPNDNINGDASAGIKPCCLIPSIKPLYRKMKGLMLPIRRISMTPRKAIDYSMIPCIAELQAAGIKFSENPTPKSMLDVTFKDGIMSFPHLTIDYSTNLILRNLLAFEQFCPNNDNYIAYYITFLNYIIDTAKDVTILRQCNIMENMLGSEEEVALLFNQLGRDVKLEVYGDYLEGNLIEDVNEYCESKWHKHRATCMRDYFNSPWTMISVLAAIAVLVMTLIQVIFAVLSY